MSTAREQARQAAIRVDARIVPEGHVVEAIADAASDIWEPLLRDLVAVIDEMPHQHSAIKNGISYRQAKKALSDG